MPLTSFAYRLVWSVVLVLSAVPAWAAPIWVEVDDAGDLVATAQDTVGGGTLSTIHGNLSNPDPSLSAFDIDLYSLFIVDPLNFSASTVDAPGFHVGDPQLFLFDGSGQGVYMNDDDESGLNAAQSLLPAGHPFGPVAAGLYYLAIGWFDNEPTDLVNLIFASMSATGVNGPEAGSGPLAAWNQNVLQRIDLETLYEINLTGVNFAVPEPGTLVLLGTGLVGAARVRRRRAAKKHSGLPHHARP
jgi:hypothetical protein